MDDFPDRYHQCFFDVFFFKYDFPIFGHFDPLETPYEGMVLLHGAFGDTTIGPRPFLGLNHNPEKGASSIGSSDPNLGQDLQD